MKKIQDSQEAALWVESGGLLAYPTDTLYGMGCCIQNLDQVKTIRNLKESSLGKPLSVLFPPQNKEEILNSISFSGENYFDALMNLLPGPYTFIVPIFGGIPKSVVGEKNSVGMRMIQNPLMDSFFERFKQPIITTSINLEGKPPLENIEEIKKFFMNREDILVLEDPTYTPKGTPSSIVDLSNGPAKLIRRGMGLEKLKLFFKF